MSSFTLSAGGDAARRVLSVRGEVDVAAAQPLADAGLSGLADPSVTALVVDLSGVTFMDSSGLAALIKIRNASLELNKALSLRGVDGPSANLLRLTALEAFFPLEAES